MPCCSLPGHIHFIGALGRGMGPVVAVVAASGVRITGSDQPTAYGPLRERLQGCCIIAGVVRRLRHCHAPLPSPLPQPTPALQHTLAGPEPSPLPAPFRPRVLRMQPSRTRRRRAARRDVARGAGDGRAGGARRRGRGSRCAASVLAAGVAIGAAIAAHDAITNTNTLCMGSGGVPAFTRTT